MLTPGVGTAATSLFQRLRYTSNKSICCSRPMKIWLRSKSDENWPSSSYDAYEVINLKPHRIHYDGYVLSWYLIKCIRHYCQVYCQNVRTGGCDKQGRLRA